MSTSTTYAQASIYQEVGRRSAIEGASPHRLVEMLLEGAMINIERAVTAIQDNDIEARGKWINKTIDIVAELRNSLDIERGGEIAENLHRLYSFMETTLTEAHINGEIQGLDTTSRLLNDLLITWKEIKGA